MESCRKRPIAASRIDTITGHGCQSPDLTIAEGFTPEETGTKRRRVRRGG